MENAQILIVEDDTITAMDIENQLKNLGYGVTAKVSHGEDAIKEVRKNTPDLVLMDIVLKGEMDGIEAADEIRSQFDIPVVFLTAYVDRKRLERAKLTTPFGFIIKPFQDKDFRLTIEMALYVAKADAERKQAEEALRESEEKFRSVFEDSAVGMVLVDPHGRYHEVNQAMSEILGYTQEEFLSMTPKDISYSGEIDQDSDIVKQLWAKDTDSIITEKRYLHKDGHTIWGTITISPVRDAEGQTIYTLGQIQDITNRKRAEEELHQIQTELEQRVEERTVDLQKERDFSNLLIQASPAFYVAIDPDGKIMMMNDALLDALGYTIDEVIGKDFLSFIPTREHNKLLKRFEDLSKHHKLTSGENYLLTKDGREIFAKWHNRLIFDKNSELDFVFGFGVDITERKQTEE